LTFALKSGGNEFVHIATDAHSGVSPPISAPSPRASIQTHRHLLQPSGPGAVCFDADALGATLQRVLEKQGLESDVACEHIYEPQGYSFVILQQGFTLCFHTWPEHRLATLDIVSTNSARANEIKSAILNALSWQELSK
jgi:hypothetical protein